MTDVSIKQQRRRTSKIAVNGSDRDIPALIEMSRSPDREVRVGAAVALGRLGTVRSVDVLLETLATTTTASVLLVSVRELLRLNERRAVHVLESMLIERGDSFDGVVGKQALVSTLGGFAERSSVPALAARLADPNGVTRKRAAKALARINYPESRAALDNAIPTMSWWRGRWARRALAGMRQTQTL
jgi:hypothetical protein